MYLPTTPLRMKEASENPLQIYTSNDSYENLVKQGCQSACQISKRHEKFDF